MPTTRRCSEGQAYKPAIAIGTRSTMREPRLENNISMMLDNDASPDSNVTNVQGFFTNAFVRRVTRPPSWASTAVDELEALGLLAPAAMLLKEPKLKPPKPPLEVPEPKKARNNSSASWSAKRLPGKPAPPPLPPSAVAGPVKSKRRRCCGSLNTAYAADTRLKASDAPSKAHLSGWRSSAFFRYARLRASASTSRATSRTA
mmetsp:Transcript_61383/g.176689  ORF Transcript_61383/g.176689 Transcript_61383/m.176689 type:complete len:202 (-) Transcript_61383:301-906(-)